MRGRTVGRTDQPTDADVVNTVSEKEVCPFGVVERSKRDDEVGQRFPSTAVIRRKLHSVTSSSTAGKNEWLMAMLHLYELEVTYVLCAMSYRHWESIHGFQNLERRCLHKPW
jgi:hypothetical protein